MSRPQLIATDLDGTFLGPDGTAPAANLLAVRRAAQAGVPVVVVTGRPARFVNTMDELAETYPLMVTSNGAALYDQATGTLSCVHAIDPDLALATADRLRHAVPGLTFGVESGFDYGCEPDGPLDEVENWGAWTAPLPEIIERCQPIIKLLGFHPTLGSDALVARALGVVGGAVSVTHASMGEWFGMVELTAPRISKASGLEAVCRSLGVDAAGVAAFGDMPNDRPMLDWAGRPFVMANSHPSLLGAGFPVIGTNTQGAVGETILGLLA